jgi:hypothetical protein
MRFVTNQRPTFQNAFMHTRCVEALCQKLNLTKTLFPGSRLRLRYAIRDAF